MQRVKIYIGSDHNGFRLKNELKKLLADQGYDIKDVGPATLSPDDDFPIYAGKVATSVLASDAKEPRGILLCGSGQGVCMAANRFKGVRASLGYDEASVRSARNDDDANVLCLPAHDLTAKKAEALILAWLATPFAGAPRFTRRIKEMDKLG